MTEKDTLPDPVKLIEQVQRSEPWNPVYRRALEEHFLSASLRAALREVLVKSDETLKNVGLTDLTNEVSIKNALRAQGIAAGLVEAVELICGLACEPEPESTEEKSNVQQN